MHDDLGYGGLDRMGLAATPGIIKIGKQQHPYIQSRDEGVEPDGLGELRIIKGGALVLVQPVIIVDENDLDYGETREMIIRTYPPMYKRNRSHG